MTAVPMELMEKSRMTPSLMYRFRVITRQWMNTGASVSTVVVIVEISVVCAVSRRKATLAE